MNEIVDRTGHTEVVIPAVEATCSSTIALPLAEHTMILISEKLAICEEDGHSGYSECIACKHAEGKKIYPAKGHADKNEDGICDECNESYIGKCNCLCHNDQFFWKIIYGIVRFIWKLSKTHPVCYCGEAHY